MPYPAAPARLACLLLGSLLSLCACAEAGKTVLQSNAVCTALVSPSTASADDASQSALSFAQWREAFRSRALASGLPASLLHSALDDLQPDPAVLKADSSQPEFSRPVWAYLDSALANSRVRQGQRLMALHVNDLQAIEQRYGVERQILVAVWGMESDFARFMGNQSVIRSLATLAHHGRRPQFAEEQLLAALQILHSGDISLAEMRGSWAGAMGQTQFMPTTYLSHAVDFDSDGKRDLWHSSSDALASAAHYLQASGWQRGQRWGFEVSLPNHFDYALADDSLRLSLAEWAQRGVQLPPGGDLQQRASLILPAGHRGPAFLVMDNFRAILRYNNSTSYGLAIGLLSDALLGRPGVRASWPRSDQPLSRSQRIGLQEALQARSYNPGPADGIIGANTRRAIRAYQQSLGWPADGYPDLRLLEELQKQP